MLEPAIVASGNDEKTTEGGKLIFYEASVFVISRFDLSPNWHWLKSLDRFSQRVIIKKNVSSFLVRKGEGEVK